jgi:uncharacterized phage protein (TIGR01671 family)
MNCGIIIGNQRRKMRTIKFRAWDKEEKRIWEDVESVGFYRRDVKKKGFCGATVTRDDGIPQFHEEHRLVLMQYTGLKDKNGKEIYEGDILRFRSNLLKRQNGLCIGLVKYDEELASYFLTKANYEGKSMEDYSLYSQFNYEVIGNIYENKELLEK